MKENDETTTSESRVHRLIQSILRQLQAERDGGELDPESDAE